MAALRIVYVHGIRGKPPEPQYHAEWDAALRLGGYGGDIETKMMYWADIRLGLTPEVLAEAKQRARERKAPRWSRVRPKMKGPLGYLIGFVLHLIDPIVRRVMKNLLEDVYLYFYGRRGPEDVRDAILDRMGVMLDGFQPHAVIGHSWGSVIAYDYLVTRGYGGELESLITLGSPLGNDWIQEHLGTTVYPRNVRGWLNVYDAMDAATWPDREISNDMCGPHGERLIHDIQVPSLHDEHGQRDAHSWYGYLMSAPVQAELLRLAAAHSEPESAREAG